MTVQKSYLIESLAPLVFRSGKPFGTQASAQDVVFPLPSSAAGLTRALAIGQGKLTMDEQKLENIQHEAYQKVLALSVKGPFLVRYTEAQEMDILVPKPANSIYFEDRVQKKTRLIRLEPIKFDEQQCGSDLPDGLLPVQMCEPVKGKPQGGVAFWSLNHVLQWQQGKNLSFEEVQSQGLTNLPWDIRIHVAIDPQTQAAQEGQLFQTASLDLGHQRKQAGGWESHRFGFLIQSELELSKDVVTFGGERRLSHFTQLEQFSALPLSEATVEQLNQQKGFSLNFLNPVIFANGYLPAWLDQDLTGFLPNTQVKVRLKAAAVDRWLAVSGWDSLLWKPKAMRKAVAAGSVYWFELLNDLDQSTFETLQQKIWSDDIQDQRDGFGTAILSAWTNI